VTAACTLRRESAKEYRVPRGDKGDRDGRGGEESQRVRYANVRGLN